MGLSCRTGRQENGVSVLLQTTSIILEKTLKFSVPQFLHLFTVDNTSLPYRDGRIINLQRFLRSSLLMKDTEIVVSLSKDKYQCKSPFQGILGPSPANTLVHA